MIKALEELYFHLNEGDRILSKYAEYNKAKGDYEAVYDKLEAVLGEEQKQQLDELFMQSGGLEGEVGLIYFCEGVKLGLKLGFLAAGD